MQVFNLFFTFHWYLMKQWPNWSRSVYKCTKYNEHNWESITVEDTKIPPAWPIRRPGGAVTPAINATTGFSVPLSCFSCCTKSYCQLPKWKKGNIPWRKNIFNSKQNLYKVESEQMFNSSSNVCIITSYQSGKKTAW